LILPQARNKKTRQLIALLFMFIFSFFENKKKLCQNLKPGAMALRLKRMWYFRVFY